MLEKFPHFKGMTSLHPKEDLIENGLRVQDILEISPFTGKTIKVDLLHSNLAIQSKQIDFPKRAGGVIILPQVKKFSFHLRIRLINISIVNRVKYGRFFLESLDENPFRINGVYTMNAFLERGDIIDFGYSKIVCRTRSFYHGFAEHPVLKNEKLLLSDLPILIHGATGTGKSRLAKKIHKASGRVGPFIPLNLCSIPLSLMEAELFGRTKGAYTGAISCSKGAFMEAQDGTLFLDEIDSLPIEIQTKLLLFLDHREFRKIGSSGIQKTNARIICASGSYLPDLVQAGKMRRDFYFRISSGHSIRLKTLAEKPSLIRNICEQFAEENNVIISEDLKQFYERQPWQGNIRELKLHLKKKMVLSLGVKWHFDEVDEHLLAIPGLDFCQGEEKSMRSMSDIQKAYAEYVYHRYHRRVDVTAKVLAMHPNTVSKLLRGGD